jgi:hypothetical protein
MKNNKSLIAEEGANGFFPKPVERGELIGFLDALPGMRKEENQNIGRNQGKERYSSFQRRLFITLILSLLTLFFIRMSEAQEPFPRLNRPDSRIDGQRMHMKPPELDLTEEQAKTLEKLRHTYMAEAIPIRTGLLALKIALRYLLTDPNVRPQILFDHQRKISALQARLEELSLSYQVKARSIFRKEQLERLPQGWAFEMGLECEIPAMDTGRRSKRGLQ